MKGQRFFIYLSFLMNSIIVFGQCPLNINETTVAPSTNLMLHLPLDGDLTNLGLETYTMDLSGANYIETQCGQGLSFDGVDDFLTISPSMSLTNNFTISAWISPNSQEDWTGIFSIREQCATSYRGYSIVEFGIGNYDVPTLSHQINQHISCTGSSGGDRYTNTSIDIPNGAETFISLVVQNNYSEDRIVKLYVNCQEFDTFMTLDWPSAVSFNSAINYVTTIGGTSNVLGQTNTFNGVIDEVRVYDDILTFNQLLDIYQSCLPVSIDVLNFPNCSSDSAQINLYNSQIGVTYQLVDVTNGVQLGVPQFGNCSPLMFSTGIANDTTQFQILAIDTASNCTLTLDSTITLMPTNGSIYSSSSIDICSEDSILIGNQYITAEGTYYDTIPFSPFCDSIITYTINLSSPIVNLGNDTTMCLGNILTLDQNQANASYLWSDNSTNSTFDVTQTGTYWVEIIANNCFVSDTINVDYISSPIVNLGIDTTLCIGSSLTLDQNQANGSYLWSDNSTNSWLEVTQTGTYWVEINANNCSASDTINVNYINSPMVNLGNDTTLCVGHSLTLFQNQENTSYLWSDNSINSNFNVTKTGTYWVTSTNSCGSIIDSISVVFENCTCEVYIPNAFTPNGDGINDLFQPKFDCVLDKYEFLIYNRWGEIIYKTNNLNSVWNGSVNEGNFFAPNGIYICICNYSHNNTFNQTIGSVTLLR